MQHCRFATALKVAFAIGHFVAEGQPCSVVAIEQRHALLVLDCGATGLQYVEGKQQCACAAIEQWHALPLLVTKLQWAAGVAAAVWQRLVARLHCAVRAALRRAARELRFVVGAGLHLSASELSGSVHSSPGCSSRGEY